VPEFPSVSKESHAHEFWRGDQFGIDPGGTHPEDLRLYTRTERILLIGLILAGIIGCAAGVPFSISVLNDPAAGGPINPIMVWLRAFMEALFLLTPASVLGMWLGRKMNLTRISERVQSFIIPSIIVGLALAIPGLVGRFSIPQGDFGPGMSNPTPLEWLFRSLSAALTEEIFFRLGLMTLFVWIIRFIVKKPTFDKSSFWIGNLLAALVFAGAHLQPVLSIDVPNWNLVILIVVFNSFAGVVLGWLYVRYCLLAAIFAHFIADFVQHVIPRLI
jgi:hypothetical protein